MGNPDLKAARASNRDVPTATPGPFQDCSTAVHLAVFFDGTGNNRDADTPNRKWSNVARMFDAAHFKPDQGVFRIYVSGIGTKFNGPSPGIVSTVWVEDKEWGGGTAGWGGDRRLDLGQDNVNARLRDMLIANAQKLGGEAKAYADASEGRSFAEVNKALGQHRLIKTINLSVVGFSRGAALARAFVNRIVDQCTVHGKELHYQGYPLRITFQGLFDTVASFGLPSANVRTPWSERELTIPPQVERCVHYIAAHELRFSFPVDRISQKGKVDPRHEECLYPGVHSDVGGGYDPNAQSVNDNYARIPMRSMMFEAVWAGVRLSSHDLIRKERQSLYKERFEVLPETERAYSSYLAAYNKLPSGTFIDGYISHMRLLYSAYGSMHRADVQAPADRRRAESPWLWIGPKGMAWEVGKYRTAAKLGRLVRLSDEKNLYARYIKPDEWQMQAWDSAAPSGVVEFVSQFVHDSKVDFLANVEPFSYFSPRGIHESTRSIWKEGYDWLSHKGQRVEEAAQLAYTSTSAAAREAKERAERAAHAAAEKAQQGYQQGKDAVQRGANAVQRQAEETKDSAQRMVESGVQWTKETAEEVSESVSQTAKATYDKSAKVVRQGAQAVEDTAKKASDGVSQAVDDSLNWLKEKAGAVKKGIGLGGD